MQFLNPLVLLGLAAAGIPVLLHLLNLRKLRTVEFSSLRFLQELQQSRVRKLRVQQILLLILRTLLVVFAVLAFARPTIPTVLPVLGTEVRTSVVILVDNSGSMAAADQRGTRFRQAQEAAKAVIASLADGDEVAVVPMAGLRLDRAEGFTRSLAAARGAVDRLEVTSGVASIHQAMRAARLILSDASHANHDIVIITDGQRNLAVRDEADSVRSAAGIERVVIVPVGEGNRGIEQNCSVDSVKVLTALIQPDKPVEIEAWIRNGSEVDAAGVAVGLSFNGVRVAQRAIDVPAGETRGVVLAAPPQRTGIVAASVELDDDALDADNVRHAALVIAPPPRVAVVGPSSTTAYVETVFAVKGYSTSLPSSTSFTALSSALSTLANYDVVMLCGGPVSDIERRALVQYVREGGSVVMFATEEVSTATLATDLGLRMAGVSEAASGAPYRVTKVEGTHPLFDGVFRVSSDVQRTVDLPVVRRQRDVGGQQQIMATTMGGFVVESQLGAGRAIAVGVAPMPSWSSLVSSGVFPAFVVRSVYYAASGRSVAATIQVGERTQIPVARQRDVRTMSIRDVYGAEVPAMMFNDGDLQMVSVPGQQAPGVVAVMADSVAVAGVAVQASTDESRLEFLETDALRQAVMAVSGHDVVDVVNTTRPLSESYRASLRGSELWPLFVVLAVVTAIVETMVARFFAREREEATTSSQTV